MSQLFATSSELDGAVEKHFGHRYNGRYHMPLLPGEQGTKSGGDWVPRGIQSATNLAGSISETRALGIWERERTQLGLALRPDLYERMAFAVRSRVNAGLDLGEKLRSTPDGAALQAELELIHEEARAACKANAGAIHGTNRHDVWEARAATGQLLGTPEINDQVVAIEKLLERNGLARVHGLQEKVVRHTGLAAAGRFDDVLITTRELSWLPVGTLLMADLKTSVTPFWSLLEVGIQLYVYATADWMLADDPSLYVPGPRYHVNQKWAVVLKAPRDGAAPELIRIDLEEAMVDAYLARDVCTRRSLGKSVHTLASSAWPS